MDIGYVFPFHWENKSVFDRLFSTSFQFVSGVYGISYSKLWVYFWGVPACMALIVLRETQSESVLSGGLGWRLLWSLDSTRREEDGVAEKEGAKQPQRPFEAIKTLSILNTN